MWQVNIHKQAIKRARKMPKREQQLFRALVKDLTVTGALQTSWPNYSKLGGRKHHCHLSYKWVACWEESEGELYLIDVYYVGSREDAPY